jgi:hypothetical protein
LACFLAPTFRSSAEKRKVSRVNPPLLRGFTIPTGDAKHRKPESLPSAEISAVWAYTPYIGKELANRLLRQGLALMTKVRKNMKVPPMTLADKLLLKARNMAETIIGHIKAFSSLNLPKHRSPVNAFIHLIAALTAYQLNPIQPNSPSALQLP